MTPEAPSTATARPTTLAVRSVPGWLTLGALIAAAVAAGLIAYFVTRSGSDHSAATRAPAAAVTIRQLDQLAASARHPVYWAGSQPGDTYELSKTSDGRIYIRYLTPGARVGDPHAKYLVVGTYPQRHAFATLVATAKSQGAATIKLRGGGLAFQDRHRPTSVYLAYPGSNYQIEVYNPSPARSLSLVASGQIAPVGAQPRTGAAPTSASFAQLKSLAVSLGHPVYWAGAQSKDTYELTRTTDGRVFIRYLPPGVAVGDARPDYLTVGTYPLSNAYALVRATAARNHVQPLRLADGGLGFVDRKRPTSIYVAYPGSNLELEVFDPSAAQARRLVLSGQIAPVR